MAFKHEALSSQISSIANLNKSNANLNSPHVFKFTKEELDQHSKNTSFDNNMLNFNVNSKNKIEGLGGQQGLPNEGKDRGKVL